MMEFQQICIRIMGNMIINVKQITLALKYAMELKYRRASLFAVDTSYYFGPRIPDSKIKRRHILTRSLVFRTNFSKQMSKFADKRLPIMYYIL